MRSQIKEIVLDIRNSHRNYSLKSEVLCSLLDAFYAFSLGLFRRFSSHLTLKSESFNGFVACFWGVFSFVTSTPAYDVHKGLIPNLCKSNGATSHSCLNVEC